MRALLEGAGLGEEAVSRELAAILAPILAPAVQSTHARGDAEAQFRARFQAFLDWHAANA